jgi:Domain of unknown function (DUF4037)
VAVLLAEGEPRPLDGVPAEFRGWPTEAVVVGIGTFLTWLLGFDPRAGISTRDWLVTPQQSLASVTARAVYHDGLGELDPVRQALPGIPARPVAVAARRPVAPDRPGRALLWRAAEGTPVAAAEQRRL